MSFEDNSREIKAIFERAGKAFLAESGLELEARAKTNSRVDQGELKGSWRHEIHDDEMMVGSDLENAIWEEFGTGEYALHGDGRKGGWLYKNRHGKTVFTMGKKPNRTLKRAYDSLKPKLINRAKELYKL